MIAHNQRGNVLPFVIVGVAMAMALGMGMFYMTSTSFLGQAGGSGMERAHQLALAGRDYALANWDNPSKWDRSDRDFTLSAATPTEGFSLKYTGGRIKSTGFVNRNTPFEAKKTLTAFPPSPVKKSLIESFDDLSKWATGLAAGEIGSHAISGQDLDVTAATAAAYGTGSGTWSLLQLAVSSAGVDFTAPWRNAGYCLSYDLQAKIKNDSEYYMAGLIFKISNDRQTFYGVSFARFKKTCYSFFGCSDTDDIHPAVKPPILPDQNVWEPIKYIYSQPALVLWKSEGGSFTWLAYKILDSANLVVDEDEDEDEDEEGKLIPWSTLQVRLQEVYEFSGGDPNLLKKGAVVIGQTNAAHARITEDPIWTSATVGVFRLTDVSRAFESGEQLKVGGEAAATLGGRTNLVRVYYGDAAIARETSDEILTNDVRKWIPSGEIYWPPDTVAEWNNVDDRMTLVSPWDGRNTGVTLLGGIGPEAEKEADAIIKDGSLLTPPSGPIDKSGVALHATGGTATSTFFDDFALQY
jgi:hypothetical protein